MKRRFRVSAALLLLSGLLAAPLLARPGNPERYPVGTRTCGMGGIGIGFGSEPWHNPAGLGKVRHMGLAGSLSAYGYTTEEVPSFIDFDRGGRIRGGMETTSVDIFPLNLAYVKPMGEWLGLYHGLGLSLVLPDYHQFDGALDVPPGELMFELRARLQQQWETYWAVGGWGACYDGWLCFGAGPAIALHLEEELTILTTFAEYSDGSIQDTAQTHKSNMLAAAVGGHAGLQVMPVNGFWLGATVRSPVQTFYGDGNLLDIFAVVDTHEEQTSYLDRVEVADPRVDFRSPWRFGFGLGYDKPGEFSVGADVRLYLAQDEYLTLSGPGGEFSMAPSTPGGKVEDPEREVYVARTVETDTTANFSLGAEVGVSDAVVVQAGAFTDLTSTPKERVRAREDNRLSRVGGTFGLGWKSEWSTSWASLVYAYGWGENYGIRHDGEKLGYVLTGLTAHSLMIVLGSSAPL